jgi:hypothetical protein
MHFIQFTLAILAAKIMYPFVMFAIAFVCVLIKGIFEDVVEKLKKRKGGPNRKK